MANAWLYRPLPNVGAVATAGTLQKGAGEYAFNDYAGVVCQLACDWSGGGEAKQASLQFDLGADTPIDALMIFGLELLPATSTITLRLATAAQGNFTGSFTTFAPVSAYAGSVRPTSGKGVAAMAFPAATVRYVWITFTAPATGASVRLSRIAIGKRLTLERNFGFGAGFGVRDLGAVDFSPKGVMLRRRSRKLRTAAIIFSNIHRDEVATQTAPLIEQVGNTEVVALLSDPDPDARIESRAYCGPLVGDLSNVVRKPDAWEAKINVVSLF